jgi:hypothetical protein
MILELQSIFLRTAQKIKQLFVYDKPLQQERMAICRQCKYYSKFRCDICKCIMPLKTRIAEESCPILQWVPKSHMWKK